VAGHLFEGGLYVGGPLVNAPDQSPQVVSTRPPFFRFTQR
jgi:hypothetical protein